jgi:hypothetical protein
MIVSLRKIRDLDETGPGGERIEGRLQTVIKRIVEDINKAGALCDHYTKKGIISEYMIGPAKIPSLKYYTEKLFGAKKYEEILIEHGNRFIKHRQDLEQGLAIHTGQRHSISSVSHLVNGPCSSRSG